MRTKTGPWHCSTPADLARQRQVVDAFLAALRDGDFGALLAVLDPDVVFREDSAAPSAGTPSLMRGARGVAGYALTYSRQARFVQPALVNGTAGLAIAPHGRLIGAIGFTSVTARSPRSKGPPTPVASASSTWQRPEADGRQPGPRRHSTGQSRPCLEAPRGYRGCPGVA